MNQSFSENLFFTNETGKHLYETYAKDMPIIDYHCHLQPKEIYENKQFEDLGEMWLAHDHYKWRAMRTFGIDERLITGDASYYEKFCAFAAIMPELAGNPLYIWCALELKRFFGIDEPLCSANADDIYKRTKALIAQKHMCPRWCMEFSNVKLVSTTEDPVDTLEYHFKLREEKASPVRVISAFRPDKAMYCEKDTFASYIPELEAAAGMSINTFTELLTALEKRLQFFKTIGTTVSDCGLQYFNYADFEPQELDSILVRAKRGLPVSAHEVDQFRTAFLLNMACAYARNGFVMQLHIGAYVDANSKGYYTLGKDTGYDCTDDATQVKSIGMLLDRLNMLDALPKTILYPLNAANAEPYAILAAAFCGGGVRAKVQLGAPWWFNDQVYGIERQFEATANLYPMSLCVGMLTDSRSFLSYPRHELYRRVLCNYLGKLVERGEYFSGEAELKKIIENVCYNNVKEFFGF